LEKGIVLLKKYKRKERSASPNCSSNFGGWFGEADGKIT